MRARTWKLQLNLDEFNAAFAALIDDSERGRFACGLSVGMNQGTPRKGASEPFLEGYALGKSMRDEAESYRQMKSAIGKKGGPQSWGQKDEPTGKPTGAPNANPILNPVIPISKESLLRPTPSDPSQGGTVLEKPAKQEPKPKKPKPADQTPEQILGGGKGTPVWESYWKLVATFGGQPKNPAPKTTAKMYVNALNAGQSAERIQTLAQELRNATSEVKYMPSLANWFSGGGYLTPDLPKAQSATPSKSPAHRAGVDAAYLEQLKVREANRPPQVEATDEEIEEIWGKFK